MLTLSSTGNLGWEYDLWQDSHSSIVMKKREGRNEEKWLSIIDKF